MTEETPQGIREIFIQFLIRRLLSLTLGIFLILTLVITVSFCWLEDRNMDQVTASLTSIVMGGLETGSESHILESLQHLTHKTRFVRVSVETSEGWQISVLNPDFIRVDLRPENLVGVSNFSPLSKYRTFVKDLPLPYHRRGKVRVSLIYENNSTVAILALSVFGTIILIYLLMLTFFLQSRKMIQDLTVPITSFTEFISKFSSHLHPETNASAPFLQMKETAELYRRFVELQGILENQHQMLLRQSKEQTLGRLASQVAHDIQSPLAALNMINQSFASLPEDARLVIRSAISRIKDIANHLIKNYRTGGSNSQRLPLEAENEPISIEPIANIIEAIVAEKRFQFQMQKSISIETQIDESAYYAFATIQPSEFKRILSNLINNSVEAITGNGKVQVELAGPIGSITEEEIIQIFIRDSGSGIPAQILPLLGQKSFSFNKKEGTGLGLFHAKNRIESWNGRIEIKSTLGSGTTVVLTLPKTPPPRWFTSELVLSPDTHVITLDDDPSIHHLWDYRIQSIKQKNNIKPDQIPVTHFSTVRGFENWYEINQTRFDKQNSIFLIDHEFLGDEINGLKLIENFRIGEKSVLVTNRSDEVPVRNAAEKLEVQMIPKQMARWVPIRVACE